MAYIKAWGASHKAQQNLRYLPPIFYDAANRTVLHIGFTVIQFSSAIQRGTTLTQVGQPRSCFRLLVPYIVTNKNLDTSQPIVEQSTIPDRQIFSITAGKRCEFW
jgi:hypothetical protein